MFSKFSFAFTEPRLAPIAVHACLVDERLSVVPPHVLAKDSNAILPRELVRNFRQSSLLESGQFRSGILSSYFCPPNDSIVIPDGRPPGEPHGVGGDPLPPQVQGNILGLDLDSDPLTQPTQRVINGAGSHGHRILKKSVLSDSIDF